MILARHLKKAPITEALIDIQVVFPPDVDYTNLTPIKDRLAKDYPKSKEQKSANLEIHVKSGELLTPTTKGRILGYILRSADDKQVAQFRVNGFTFSRLRPYETWEQLRDEARRLWELYLDIATPQRVTRVAVRYINDLNIPLPVEDFGDYITAPPPLPETLPQGVSSFLTRVVIREPSLGADAIITQALDAIVKPDFAPIILDIDAFKVAEFTPKSADVWDTLEQLRVLKNKIFFESITEKAVELYQ